MHILKILNTALMDNIHVTSIHSSTPATLVVANSYIFLIYSPIKRS